MNLLLIDIGNTHTHVGMGGATRVGRRAEFPTPLWDGTEAAGRLRRFLRGEQPLGLAFCTVVPRCAPAVRRFSRAAGTELFQLSARTLRGIGVDYPNPRTIGADRLANALAVCHHYGAPSVVVDFGTAVTFDVVDKRSRYVGGVIAPGLNVMTDYLHEKTALLPRVRLREIRRVIGRTTEEAMLIGATHGYRGLIRQLVLDLRQALDAETLPVIATGGYARLLAARLPEITAVVPALTLEGLRLAWFNQAG